MVFAANEELRKESVPAPVLVSERSAPLIATGLLQWSAGRPWPVAVYLILMVLITLLSVYKAAETSRRDLS